MSNYAYLRLSSHLRLRWCPGLVFSAFYNSSLLTPGHAYSLRVAILVLTVLVLNLTDCRWLLLATPTPPLTASTQDEPPTHGLAARRLQETASMRYTGQCCPGPHRKLLVYLRRMRSAKVYTAPTQP